MENQIAFVGAAPVERADFADVAWHAGVPAALAPLTCGTVEARNALVSTDLPFRLVLDPTHHALELARACETDVFLTHYGNTLEQLAAEYGPYESHSVFMALLDQHDCALAACRLIRPGPDGLKSINDVERAPWGVDGARAARAAGLDLSRTWDVATIAVRKEAGAVRPLAAAALYHGLWAAARANDVRSIVMIIDERARRLLSAVSIITQTLPGTGPGEYLGSSTSTPLYGNLAQMAANQRRLNPDAYRLIGQGIGLDGIELPTPEEWRLSGARAGSTVGRPAPAMSA